MRTDLQDRPQSLARPRIGRLRRNLLLLYGGEAVGKALAMVVFVRLAAVLGPSRFGDVEAATAAWFLLSLVLEAGMDQYGSREAARHPGSTARLASRVAWIRLLSAAACLAALGGYALFSRGDALAKVVLLLYGLVLLPAPFFLNWAFQARDESELVAFPSLLRQTILAAGVFLFVSEPSDAWMVPLCEAVGFGSLVLVQQRFFRRRVGRIRPIAERAGSRRVWIESLPIMGSSCFWALRLFFPTLALKELAGSVEAGFFAIGHRWVIALHTFVWLYFFNLLPSLSRCAAADDRSEFRQLLHKSYVLVVWGAPTACLVGSLVAPTFVGLLYADEYEPAIAPFQLLVWMLAASFVSGHMRWSLIAFRRQTDEFLANLAGAAVCVAACLALGSELDAWSAAGILVAGEVTALVVAKVLLRRQIADLGLVRRSLRPATAIGVAAVVATRFDTPWIRASAALTICALGALLLQRDLPAALRSRRASSP